MKQPVWLYPYLQTLSILTKSRMAWPKFVEDVLNAFSFLNLNLELVTPECYIPEDNSQTYEYKYIGTLVTSFVLFLVLFTPFVLFLVLLILMTACYAYQYYSIHQMLTVTDHISNRTDTVVSSSRAELKQDQSMNALDETAAQTGETP